MHKNTSHIYASCIHISNVGTLAFIRLWKSHVRWYCRGFSESNLPLDLHSQEISFIERHLNSTISSWCYVDTPKPNDVHEIPEFASLYGASLGGSQCNTSKNVGTTSLTDESWVKNHTKSTYYLINIITMVLEPLAPSATWIWWIPATWRVGGLAHVLCKAAVKAI